MEGLPVTVYKGLRVYWRRRGYQKLHGSVRRRVWWIKVSPKLMLSRVMSAPNKLLLWLRDTYVNTMLKLASSRNFTAGYGGGFGGALGSYGGDGPAGFGASLKECDRKMMIDIYKSLAIAQGLVPRDAERIGAEIVFKR